MFKKLISQKKWNQFLQNIHSAKERSFIKKERQLENKNYKNPQQG